MLGDIKKELEKRKEEREQLKQTIENERRELKEKREKESRGILHKSKTIHKVISNVEEKKDEKYIAKFIQEEQSKLNKARSQRRREMVRANKSRIIKLCIAVLAVIVAILAIVGIVVSYNEQHRKQEEQAAAEARRAQMEEQYEKAISLILKEDYKAAESELTDNDIRDSAKLLEYVQLMQDLESYKGKLDKVLVKLRHFAEFEDSNVETQRKNVCDLVDETFEIQKQIDGIDRTKVDISSKDMLAGIKMKMDSLDKQYLVLLNTEKYDQALQTIANLEQNTKVGQLIVAIRGIGAVSLESESQLTEIRTSYDALSADEQKQVVNYSTLQDAEISLEKLKKEKKEAEEKAAQEAAEQAEREREQAEKERQEQERREAWYNATVFVTATGNCYHYDGCSTISNSAYPMTRREAINRGYVGCGVCYSGGGMP